MTDHTPPTTNSDTPEPPPPPPPSTPSPSAPPKKKRKKAGVKHHVARTTLVSLALVLLAWWYFTGTWFLKPRVEAILSGFLGCEATVGQAFYGIMGHVVLRDVQIHVNDVPGEAGELVSIQKVILDVPMRDLFKGRVVTDRITITNAHIRISESTETGKFNFGGLIFSPGGPDGPDGPDGPPAATVIPHIILERATLEVGEHGPAGYRPTGEITVTGKLLPETSMASLTSAEPNWFRLDLEELVPKKSGENKSVTPLRVSGKFNLATGESSALIEGVSFDTDRAGLFPREVRQWWETVDPSGQLEPVVIEVGADGHYRVDIKMDGLDWSLPVPGFNLGLTTVTPRMTDVQGSIIIRHTGVELTGLSGVIDGVRYGLKGEFTSVDLSPGFKLHFDVKDFDLKRNLSILTALPPNIRHYVDSQLVSLHGQSGKVNARVTLQRNDRPKNGGYFKETEIADRPIHAEGIVEIKNAEGTYDLFPYPLEGLDGTIHFNDDEIRIVSLAGTGPSGASVFVSGTVRNIGPDPEVNIDLYAENVPIDEHLRRGLGPKHRQALDLFFDEDAERALHEAGLFLRSAEQEAVRRELNLKKRQRQAAIEKHPQISIDEIETAIAELERQAALPIFDLGGEVSISASFHRTSSQPGVPSQLDFKADLKLTHSRKPIGLMYRILPYPGNLTGGAISIRNNHVELSEPLTFEGPLGGHATLTGSLDRLLDPRPHIAPNLKLTASEVPLSPLLSHVIPDGGHNFRTGNWPGAEISNAAKLLDSLRVAGPVSTEGWVVGVPGETKPDYEFTFTMTDGRTRTTPLLPQTLDRARAWSWPPSLPLEEIDVTLVLSTKDLAIINYSGRRGTESFKAKGLMSWDQSNPLSLTLNVQGDDMALGPQVMEIVNGLIPDEQVTRLADFWEQYDPAGVVDFDLNVLRHRQGGEEYTLLVEPSDLRLMVRECTLRLHDASGRIEIDGAELRFDQLAGVLTANDEPSGSLVLSGIHPLDGNRETTLNGQLTNGRFESPLLRLAPGWVDRSGPQDERDTLNLAGVYDAIFTATTAGDRITGVRATVSPHSVDLNWRGERFELRDLMGSVRVAPGIFEFIDLAGRFQDGTCHLNGTVHTSGPTDPLDADLRFDISADHLGPHLRALLPDAANEVIDTLSIEIHEPVELRNAHLRYRESLPRQFRIDQNRTIELPVARTWESVEFDGTIVARNASLNVAVPIEAFDGSIDLHVTRHRDDEWLQASVLMHVNEMRAKNRLVTDVEMRFLEGDRPGEILLPYARGRCYDGQVEAHGKIRVPWGDEPGEYSLWLSMSDVLVDAFLEEPEAYLESLEADASTGADPHETALAQNVGTDPGWGYASLSVSGKMDDPTSRRGQGNIRIVDAELYDVPLAMWALQISALAPPISTSFDFADINFYIDGDTVVFERLQLESPGIIMSGEGTLDYSTQELDLRFRTFGHARAPIFSILWEGLRDTLLSIHVTGSLENPKSEVQALSGFAEALRQLLGRSERRTVPRGPTERITQPQKADQPRE